jgi:3-oxoacyl-(acyl-carrier-protein) synthase
LTDIRVFIAGMGLITPVAKGVVRNWTALLKGKTGIGKLTLFPTTDDLSFPVGEVAESLSPTGPPRTHQLALMAAEEAMTHSSGAPDAIIMGSTTGGMSRTEVLLKANQFDPSLFLYHGAGSVAEYVALKLKCKGPVMTVSTACSSGTAAIAIALAFLRSGKCKKILVGGAESLCRLTYFGFHSLQLIDPTGSHPLDRDRKGLTVSEGAGMLLLEGKHGIVDADAIEILGAGLTCDAYHPASPDPEGLGALSAMKNALEDAGLTPRDMDYINLHGTGTIDNDLSEAKAFNGLFDGKKPLVSSVKGAFGHSLSAAGAIEAVISARSIQAGMAPASVGCRTPDPLLKLEPLKESKDAPIRTVMSNSFGFGGGNASVVMGRPRESQVLESKIPVSLEVVGISCITGAGDTSRTLNAFSGGLNCRGLMPENEMCQTLSPRATRRLKRLSKMGLSLAMDAFDDAGDDKKPDSVFFGTGWGALSETHDFLKTLYETNERFSSPTDFMGSVHNATAGRIAIKFKARGPNITTTGGNDAFEQALMSAHLLATEKDTPLLVMGADEFHPVLSELFDPSAAQAKTPSDGGGALLLRSTKTGSGPRLTPLFHENTNENHPHVISSLIKCLGGSEKINLDFGAVFAGLPAQFHAMGGKQLDLFIQTTGFNGPVIDYRRYLGEFASASAVAAILAVSLLKTGEISFKLTEKETVGLNGKGILLLGFGNVVAAVAVLHGDNRP